MKVLHFVMVNADDADDAASKVVARVSGWCRDDNWFDVGGVASEDGADDVEKHGGGFYGLSFLHHYFEGLPQGGTCFQRAVAAVRQQIGAYPDLRSACAELAERLRAFDPERHGGGVLRKIRDDIVHVSDVFDSRGKSESGEDIPEFRAGRFDDFGLTDMTGETEGARRYIIFLDMHR